MNKTAVNPKVIYNRIYRKRATDAGFCCTCLKNPARPGFGTCESCAVKKQADYHQARVDRKAANLCLKCGLNCPVPNRSLCVDCATLKAALARDRATSKMKAGLCRRCGTNKARTGSTHCERCTLKITSTKYFGDISQYKLLGRLFVEQNGVCPYTGIKLGLGVDASIDHIIPRSAGGSNDADNVEWVHIWINFMKLSTPKSVFNGKLDDFLIAAVKHRFGVDLSSHATDLSAVSPALSSVSST